MKTLKWKLLAAAGMVSAFFVLTSADSSLNTGANESTTTEISPGGDNIAPPSSPNGRFEKENMDIRSDISSMSIHKDRIQALKDEYRADKKAYRDSKSTEKKMEIIVDKKDLAKARADLKRDKQYLKADKRDLKCDHKLALKERKKEIRENKQALRETRRTLDNELAKGNEASAREYASKVVRMQNKVNSSETALERDRKDMKDNLTAVNKAIRNSDSRSENNGAVVARTTSDNNTSSSR